MRDKLSWYQLSSKGREKEQFWNPYPCLLVSAGVPLWVESSEMEKISHGVWTLLHSLGASTKGLP